MAKDDPLALPMLSGLLAALEAAPRGPREAALHSELLGLLEAARRPLVLPPPRPEAPSIRLIVVGDDDDDPGPPPPRRCRHCGGELP